LLVAGGAVLVVAMWRLTRSQRGSGLPPEAMLTRSQRRELIAQLQARVPVQDERVPLIRDWAHRFVQLHAALNLVMVGGLLVSVGSAVGSREAWLVALHSCVWITLLAGLLVGRRRAGAARRFLGQHAET
jgi:hypothetical protein